MFGSASRARTAPSQYPRLPFHGLRVTQLVSSIIVGSIMIYFINALVHEHPSDRPTQTFPVPWTFIFLLASSILSVCALIFTMVMHCCIGLNPRMNLLINGGLSALWGGSWSVLTWYVNGTLQGQCSLDTWNAEEGVMVCRIYKTLFTFALLGFLSTLAAFCLDVYVRRRQTRSGIYRLHDVDADHGRKASQQAFPAGLQFAPATHQPAHQGYSQPEEQLRYDTSYQPGYNH
ncbi:hypothetical protein AMS68_006933 [Peltaster fructicola]|uniref:MARVEL domain-containing protein n=1 Tax=Peltaster fructicola TaxID=286661 RepID=A0A6H0Y390_9PEZI|nr:hypothetical protein AMS68_006933 [Peltaster fructicola]